MAVSIQDGSLIAVFVNGVAVGYSTACSLSVSNELLDANWKGASASGKNPAKYGGTVSWSVSCDGLVDLGGAQNWAALTDAVMAGDLVVLKIGVGDFGAELDSTLTDTVTVGSVYYTGSAYVESTEGSFSANEDGTYSVSFTGSGALTKGTTV